MNTVHLTGFTSITTEGVEGIALQYKPDVPKLRVHGTLLVPETEEELPAIILITQKQLNQVFAGKDIDLKVQQNEWILNKSLTKDQIRKIGLIPLKVHHHGRIEESEVVEILTVG